MKARRAGLWADTFSAPLVLDAAHWQRAGFSTHLRGWRLYASLARYGGFRATVIHRLAYWATRRRVPGLSMVLHEMNQALHGLEITPSMPVGGGLYMPHTVGSVITAARIGREVELQGGITIGQRKGDGFPTIEDGVSVACGARILGPITLADGTTVGANAVVVRSTSPRSVMVGIPARSVGSRREVGSNTGQTVPPLGIHHAAMQSTQPKSEGSGE